MDMQHNRSLPELVSELFNDISGLFRKEVQLAKTEVSETIGKIVSRVEVLLVGAVLLIGAVGVFLAGLVDVVSVILISAGLTEPTAHTISAFIVAIIVGGIGLVMANRGLAGLKASRLELDRTTHSLSRDAKAVKERF